MYQKATEEVEAKFRHSDWADQDPPVLSAGFQLVYSGQLIHPISIELSGGRKIWSPENMQSSFIPEVEKNVPSKKITLENGLNKIINYFENSL